MIDWQVGEEFTADDGVVRWASFGSGEPMVLLHGTPFSSFIWRDIALALANTRRVYVWDMLGFGQSDKHEGQDVSLAAQGRIFAALLGHWVSRNPVSLPTMLAAWSRCAPRLSKLRSFTISLS